jgi:hypothetical protein
MGEGPAKSNGSVGSTWSRPEIEFPNIYPVDWRVEDPRFLRGFEAAKNRTWNPTKLDWDSIDPKQLSAKERLAVAYHQAMNAMFEYAAAPQFMLPLQHLYENHEEHGVILLGLSTVRDEFIHEEFFRKVGEAFIPGFPFDYKPKTELEEDAINNLRWIEWKQSRTFARYQEKSLLERNPWVLQVSIMAPEIVGMEVFRGIVEGCPFEMLRHGYKFVDSDEARHVSYGRLLFEKGVQRGLVNDETRNFIAKLASDGILYGIGMVALPSLLDVDEKNFWLRPLDKVPPRFMETHKELVAVALEVLTGLNQDDIWQRTRAAVRKVKWVLEHNGISEFSDDLAAFRAFKIKGDEAGIEEGYSAEIMEGKARF